MPRLSRPRDCAALVLFALALTLFQARAQAEPRNHYGDAGRTILSSGLHADRSNVRKNDGLGHGTTWSAGGYLSVARFVVDNWALGGTLGGSVWHIADGAHPSPAGARTYATVDLVYHIPLHRRLSLRFWASGGLSWSRVRELETERDETTGTLSTSREQQRDLSLYGGFHPELLVHLSSSLALHFGPGVGVAYPLIGSVSSEPYFVINPGVTYSLGPNPDEPESALDDARRFSSKGREAFYFYASIRDDFAAGVGWVHFVRDGFGLGGYASTSWYENELGDTLTAGTGVQAMGDVPLSRSTSFLCVPSVGVVWKELDQEPISDVLLDVIELDATLAGYFALHLYEGLVVGVGPEVVTQFRLAGDRSVKSPYLSAGLSSFMGASF